MGYSKILASSAGVLLGLYFLNAEVVDDFLDKIMENYYWRFYEEIPPFSYTSIPTAEEFDEITKTFSKSESEYIINYNFVIAVLAFLFVTIMLLFHPRFRTEKKSYKNEFLNELQNFLCNYYNICLQGKEKYYQKNTELKGMLAALLKNEKPEKMEELDGMEVLFTGDGGKDSLHGMTEAESSSFLRKIEAMPSSRGCGDGRVRSHSSIESAVFKISARRRELASESTLNQMSTGSTLTCDEYKEEEEDVSTIDSSAQIHEPFEDIHLMERISSLESRLTAEDQKNQTWLDRMNRAEDILQSLSKQVEQLEVPASETYQITKTVTKWMQPRSQQFTIYEQQSFPRITIPGIELNTLTEIIKREIGLTIPRSLQVNEDCGNRGGQCGHRQGGLSSSSILSFM